jgi:hypothetical protein
MSTPRPTARLLKTGRVAARAGIPGPARHPRRDHAPAPVRTAAGGDGGVRAAARAHRLEDPGAADARRALPEAGRTRPLAAGRRGRSEPAGQPVRLPRHRPVSRPPPGQADAARAGARQARAQSLLLHRRGQRARGGGWRGVHHQRRPVGDLSGMGGAQSRPQRLHRRAPSADPGRCAGLAWRRTASASS